MGDRVRILRLLEYVGDRDDIEASLQNTAVPLTGEHRFGRNLIRSAMLGSFPEILERAQLADDTADRLASVAAHAGPPLADEAVAETPEGDPFA